MMKNCNVTYITLNVNKNTTLISRKKILHHRALENWIHTVCFPLFTSLAPVCEQGSPAPWMMLLFLQLWWWTLLISVVHQGARAVTLLWLVEAANALMSLPRLYNRLRWTAVDCPASAAPNLLPRSHWAAFSVNIQLNIVHTVLGLEWTHNQRVKFEGCMCTHIHLRMSEGM